MKIHAVTCSRNLIDTLFSLGICVSYDRFLRLTSDISSALLRSSITMELYVHLSYYQAFSQQQQLTI